MTNSQFAEFRRCLEQFAPIGTDVKMWHSEDGKWIHARVDKIVGVAPDDQGNVYYRKEKRQCVLETATVEKMSLFEYGQFVLANLEPVE